MRNMSYLYSAYIQNVNWSCNLYINLTHCAWEMLNSKTLLSQQAMHLSQVVMNQVITEVVYMLQ